MLFHLSMLFVLSHQLFQQSSFVDNIILNTREHLYDLQQYQNQQHLLN